nr:MAG TPA: hypothetical protein [Caudoviricetes sp.]
MAKIAFPFFAPNFSFFVVLSSISIFHTWLIILILI